MDKRIASNMRKKNNWKLFHEDPPKEPGIYMVAYELLNYPFNINFLYFDGKAFKGGLVFPIKYWSRMPDGPEQVR